MTCHAVSLGPDNILYLGVDGKISCTQPDDTLDTIVNRTRDPAMKPQSAKSIIRYGKINLQTPRQAIALLKSAALRADIATLLGILSIREKESITDLIKQIEIIAIQMCNIKIAMHRTPIYLKSLEPDKDLTEKMTSTQFLRQQHSNSTLALCMVTLTAAIVEAETILWDADPHDSTELSMICDRILIIEAINSNDRDMVNKFC